MWVDRRIYRAVGVTRAAYDAENLGAAGSILGLFECVSSVLGSYESVRQAREAGQHNPVCMYGMYVSIGIITYWECLGVGAS